MWIAILILAWNNPAITTVEFGTKQDCIEFGEKFKEQNPTIFVARYICVSKSREVK